MKGAGASPHPNLLGGTHTTIRRWLVLWDDGRHVLPCVVSLTSAFLAEQRAKRHAGSRIREIAWIGP